MRRAAPRILAAVLACGVFSAGAWTGCAAAKPDFIVFSHEAAGFKVEAPSDWTVIENPSGMNPGTQFLSPPAKGRRMFRRYITVDFFPAGNPGYSSVEDYIAAHTRSLPGVSREESRSIKVAGIPAQEVVWRKPLPQSPEFAPKGTMATRAVLLDYGGGFFALCDSRTDSEPADAGGVFERVLRSFKPSADR